MQDEDTSVEDTRALSESYRPGMFIGRNRYAIIERIAVGGQAIVYKAEDTLLRRCVAVKLLLQQFAPLPETRDRFLREAQALASIDHPNIVQLLDIDQQPDGSYFVVQQLLEGETLRERMSKRPAISREEAVDAVVLPLMGALVAAHGKGIIHRDVKPDNIVLVRTPSNERIPKLIDFGIAKLIGASGQSLTRLGVAMGTPGYMSPEQIRDASTAGAPADVWAVGMLLFELITGRLPFLGDVGTLIDMTSKRPVPGVDTLAPDVPPELAQIITDALNYDPEKRPSMRALRSRLVALRMRSDVPLAHPTMIGALPLSGDASSGSDDEGVLSRARRLNEQARKMRVSSPEIEVVEEDSAVLEEDPTLPFSFKERRAIAAATASALHLDGGSDVDGVGEIAPSEDPRVNRLAGEAVRALGMNALESSLAYVARALLLGSPKDECISGVKLVAAIAHHWLGNYAEAERFALEAAQNLSRGSTGWLTAVGYLAAAYGDRGNAKKLHSLIRDLRAVEVPAAASPAWTIAVCRLVQSLVWTGFPGPARQLLVTALKRASERGIAEMALVRGWLSVAQSTLDIHRGDVLRHLGSVALAIDAFGDGRDVRNACVQRVNAGNAYMQLGGHSEAEAELRSVLRVAEPMHLRFVPALKVNLGFALARLSRLDEALAMEVGAVELCKKQGNRRFECVGRLYLANILLRMEDAPGAIAAAEEAIHCAKDFPGLSAYAHAMLGSIYLSQSKAPRAMVAAREAMDLLTKLHSVEEGEALIRVVEAEALYASNRQGEAIKRIKEARERLLKIADEIDEPHWRRSFLEKVPENARTMRLAAEWELRDAEDDTAIR
jgi:serine/threonine protein kinase/tetratricopeptide (TPR) repeat protein